MRFVKFLNFFMFILFSINFGFCGSILYDKIDDYSDYIFYDEDNSDFAVYMRNVEDNYISFQGYGKGTKKYFPFSSFTSCSVDNSGGKLTAPFLSNDNVIKVKEKIINDESIGTKLKQKILENNLWMKVQIYYETEDEEGHSQSYSKDFSLINDSGLTKNNILENKSYIRKILIEDMEKTMKNDMGVYQYAPTVTNNFISFILGMIIKLESLGG